MQQKTRQNREEWRRIRAWRETHFPDWRLWRDLELSDEQHRDLIKARLSGQHVELMELAVMARLGCDLAKARRWVATKLREIPCPGRDQCAGGHVHASAVLEDTLAQLAAMRQKPKK